MPPISSPEIDVFQPTDFTPDQQQSSFTNVVQQSNTIDFRVNHQNINQENANLMFSNIQINHISDTKTNDDQELLKLQDIFLIPDSKFIQLQNKQGRTDTQLVHPELIIQKIEDCKLESSKTSRAEINCAVKKETIQDNEVDFKSMKSSKYNHQRNKSDNIFDANQKSFQNQNNFHQFQNLNDIQTANNPYQDSQQNLIFYQQIQEKLKHKRMVSSSISREQNLQECLTFSKKSPMNPISFKNMNLQKSIDKCNIFDYVKYLEGNNSSILNKNQQVENSYNKACPFILQEMKESKSPSNSKYKVERNEKMFNVKEFEHEDEKDVENGEVRRLSTSSSGNIVSSEKKRCVIHDMNKQLQQPFQGLKLQEFTVRLMNDNEGNVNSNEDGDGSENLVHETQENCNLIDKNSEIYNDTILNSNSNNNPIIKQIPLNTYRPCLNTQFQVSKVNEQQNAYNDQSMNHKNQSFIASQTEIERFSSSKQNSQSQMNHQLQSMYPQNQFQNNIPNQIQIAQLDIFEKQNKNQSPQNISQNFVNFQKNKFYKTVTQDKLLNIFQIGQKKTIIIDDLNQIEEIQNVNKVDYKNIQIENEKIENCKYHTFQNEGRSQNNIQQLKSLIENVHIDSLLQDCDNKEQQNQLINLYYRTQPYNKKEKANQIQFNSLIETKDLMKNRATKSVCIQKYINLILGVGDNKTENNFCKGYQPLISPVQNNANLSVNFGQSAKVLNINRGIPMGQDELAPFNNTDQKTQLNLMVDHQTNSIDNLFHNQTQFNHGIGTCFKIDESNNSNVTSKNKLSQAINENKSNQYMIDNGQRSQSQINSIPSPINGSENVNYGSQLHIQKHQNLPSNGTFQRTGIVDLNKSYSQNNIIQEDESHSRNQLYSCYKSKDDSKFNYQNYLSLLNLTKNQQINTYNFVERAYRNDKIELQKQNALLQQRVDQQKQEIEELKEKGLKSKLQYEKIIQILRKNKKYKKRYQSKNSDNHSLILEENNNLLIESQSSSDNKSISNISQISLKLLEIQQKEVENIRKLYENDQRQKLEKENSEKLQMLNEQIENLKISQKRDQQIQELRHRQELTEKNQQLMNIQQKYQQQKIDIEKLQQRLQNQNLGSPSDMGSQSYRNETIKNNFTNPTFRNSKMSSTNKENEYIFQLEQQIEELRNEIKKQVTDQHKQNVFNIQNNYQSNKSKQSQQQSRNILIETKLSLLNKFHQKNIQEDLKSSILLTRGTANDGQNFANSGSSREFLGLISKDCQEIDDKQKITIEMNEQCENLETTLECFAQKANNFIIQDENEIKKNYISSFLMGGETVEERYSATQSQNQKTFSKSLVSLNPQLENNQDDKSKDNLEKTASDSDEDDQQNQNYQNFKIEINRLQSELLQAYQKEKIYLEDFQKLNRKQNQMQEYNQILIQKNQKNVIEIKNLNYKLEQIMKILGSKQNGEQYNIQNEYLNENQYNNQSTRQLSNTKKLSFSQIDQQDNYQAEDFLTQNFEDENYQIQQKQQDNKDDMNSQMQTIEEEDVLQEDSKGNIIQSSKNENQSQQKSFVQQFEINQNSQINSISNSNCKDVYIGSNNEGSPIIIQQKQSQCRWDSIKQKSQELKMQEKRVNNKIINNSNKSYKCVPIVQLKLEDFTNSQNLLQMSAPIDKKSYFLQSHKKALFSRQNPSYTDRQNTKYLQSYSSNDFNQFRQQLNYNVNQNGNISSRSQEAPFMKKMIQNGIQTNLYKNNLDDYAIADEKEGENSSNYFQNLNDNQKYMINVKNGNNRKSNVSFSQTIPKNYIHQFQNKQKNLHERQALINSSFSNNAPNSEMQGQSNQLRESKLNYQIINKYNTQNLRNKNQLQLQDIIASLPQQELELLFKMLKMKIQNVQEINIDQICVNLTEYMERIQYQDEMDNLKSKLPFLMKHMHMLRQQEIIKQHKLHQLDSAKRYQSFQPNSISHQFPDHDDQKFILNLQKSFKVNQQENKSQGINKLPLNKQNYYTLRHYTAYDDNQVLNIQQQKNSDTSKQSLVAAELESENAHNNQNSNSQIKNVSSRFAHLQEDYNFKQLNFSFQEKQANFINQMQMENILQENIFENDHLQDEQKSVFESQEYQQNLENQSFNNVKNQIQRKKMQIRNFNEKHQKLNIMPEIEECTFEGNTGSNLTKNQESKEQKQIVNKNKIINHFYNNVQMMDIPQSIRNNNYYSQSNQQDQYPISKKNITPIFNGNQRWHSNSQRRRSSQLFFHSEKQYNEKNSQACNKNHLLHKQYNSVGSSLQLKNNREHQRSKGSVLCLLTGKYQHRASDIAKEKPFILTSQKQLLQMFPKNLYGRQNFKVANSVQYKNRSAMSLKDSLKVSNDINSSRSYF